MGWRDFLPYESYSIPIEGSTDTFEQRIRAAVLSWSGFRLTFPWSKDAGRFESDYSSLWRPFRVRRVISYRNSFRPAAHCVVVDAGDTLALRVKARMPLPVAAVLLVWSSAILFVWLVMVVATVRGLTQAHPALLLAPCGMLSFFALLVFGSFKFEAQKVRHFLEDTCGGRAVRTHGGTYAKDVVFRDPPSRGPTGPPTLG